MAVCTIRKGQFCPIRSSAVTWRRRTILSGFPWQGFIWSPSTGMRLLRPPDRTLLVFRWRSTTPDKLSAP